MNAFWRSFWRYLHWSRLPRWHRIGMVAVPAAMAYGVTAWAWIDDQSLWWGRAFCTTVTLVQTAFLAWLLRPAWLFPYQPEVDT